MNIVISYILISVLISLIFGVVQLSLIVINKIGKGKALVQYLFQFWSLVAFLIIVFISPIEVSILKVDNIFRISNLGLILVTIVPASIMVIPSAIRKYKKLKITQIPKFKIKNLLDGASMEIPQRLLVQNLFIILSVNKVIYGSITSAILLNALIWVQFIIVQELISGKKISRKIMPEIMASFWFSIWVGILYSISGNIFVPMLAHGLQRWTTHIMVKFIGKKATTNIN